MRKYIPTIGLLVSVVLMPRGLAYQAGDGYLKAATSVFSHISTGHMLSNIAALLILARPWRAPAFRLFSIFLIGGIGGNIAVTVFSQRSVLGASAGVLAVIAFETILGAHRRDIPAGLLLASTVSVIIYTAGFRPSHLHEGSTYVPHVVGVLFGILCALLVISLASRRTVTVEEAAGR